MTGLATPSGKGARIADVIALAARIWNVDRAELISKRRGYRLTFPRQAVMLVAREQGHSYPHIGNRLGGRDHSTAIHGAVMALERAARAPDYAAKLAELREGVADATPFLADRMRQDNAAQSLEQVTAAVERAAQAVPDRAETPALRPVRRRSWFENSAPDFSQEASFNAMMRRGNVAFVRALEEARA